MLHPGYVTYYYEYAQGIKTGSTEEAEYCVITKASKDGYNYLAIVMKSPQQKLRVKAILQSVLSLTQKRFLLGRLTT